MTIQLFQTFPSLFVTLVSSSSSLLSGSGTTVHSRSQVMDSDLDHRDPMFISGEKKDQTKGIVLDLRKVI